MKPSQLQTALFLNMEILTKEFGFLPAFEVGKKGEVSVLTLDGWKPARVEVAPKQNLIELKGGDEYEAVDARNLLGEDLCFAVNPWRPFDQEEIRKGIKTFLSNPSVKSGINNESFMPFIKGGVSFKYGWIMAYIEAFSQKITPGVGRRVAVKLLPDVCFPSLLKAGFWDAGIMLERDLGSPEEIFLREEWVQRGLFRSSIGKHIHADINGCLNILRKVVEQFVPGPLGPPGPAWNKLSPRVSCPVRIRTELH